MIRFLDFILSLFGILLLSPLGVILFLIGFFDTGSPIFIQERVGKNKKPFKLFKFRTMIINTESVPSHMASKSSITKIGGFLRKTKLDELPQLFNVLKGDMSLVGPRPSLFNEYEVIKEREKRGVYEVVPGVTGLSQINEIDMSTPQKIAITDAQMLKDLSVLKYFKYIFATIGGKGQGDRVSKI